MFNKNLEIEIKPHPVWDVYEIVGAKIKQVKARLIQETGATPSKTDIFLSIAREWETSFDIDDSNLALYLKAMSEIFTYGESRNAN